MLDKTDHHTSTLGRIAGCSSVGQSHLNNNAECDDCFEWQEIGPYRILLVCDGAGSAKLGAEGARLSSRLCADIIAMILSAQPSHSLSAPAFETIIADALGTVRVLIEDIAVQLGHNLNDYHHTIVGAIALGQEALLFHIGDGAAMALKLSGQLSGGAKGEAWYPSALSLPHNGQYSNETYFLTLPLWRNALRFTYVQDCDALLLMTDGLTPFALEKGGMAAAQNFIQPIATTCDEHCAEDAMKAIRNVLISDDVRWSDGDDKTLLWASNRPAPSVSYAESGHGT